MAKELPGDVFAARRQARRVHGREVGPHVVITVDERDPRAVYDEGGQYDHRDQWRDPPCVAAQRASLDRGTTGGFGGLDRRGHPAETISRASASDGRGPRGAGVESAGRSWDTGSCRPLRRDKGG